MRIHFARMIPQTLETILSSRDPSFFRNLLQPPTSSDREIIAQRLSEGEREIKDCEFKIAILLARRERLGRSTQRYKALLSPINYLPTEIISSIFELLCEENPLDPYIRAPAMTISAVCYRWRQIALSMPALWSSLDIDFDDLNPGEGARMSRTVQMFMERSQFHPLKLRLHCSYYHKQQEIIDPTLHILVENSSRWLELSFCSESGDSPDFAVWRRIKGRLPLLRRLDIDFDPEDLFADTPALSSFTCILYDIPELPFEQLSHLNIKFSYTRSVLDEVLQRCQKIQHLELEYVHEDVEDDDPVMSEVTLMNLETLKVTLAEESTLEYSMSLLLPRLTSLEYIRRYGRYYRTWEAWDNLSFFKQSSRITNLHIEGLPISDIQMGRILTCLPGLRQFRLYELTSDAIGESLSISDRTITSKFFQHLIFDDKAENTSIIPRLSELSLRAGYEGFDASGLVKMVSSRWMPRRGIRTAVDVDCLQSVEVRLGGDVANELPNEFLALESLKAAGLQVIASVERW
ncbi:hypothetical protein VNI00_001750 [Paramarasmius palmivorus]|uniref:F-box domain-containing protein n=1 Tax=Paramarasmius palmivorus TaxID=297713 RepID=A0AAW0E4N8_9AGAR